jgi:hypothetical protein
VTVPEPIVIPVAPSPAEPAPNTLDTEAVEEAAAKTSPMPTEVVDEVPPAPDEPQAAALVITDPEPVDEVEPEAPAEEPATSPSTPTIATPEPDAAPIEQAPPVESQPIPVPAADSAPEPTGSPIDAAVRRLLVRILEHAAGGAEHVTGVDVGVTDGVATLTGEVGTLALAGRLRDAAASADGIVGIAGGLRAQDAGVTVPMASEDGTGP